MIDVDRVRSLLMTFEAVEETMRPRTGKRLYWAPAKAAGGRTFAVLDPGGGNVERPRLSFRVRADLYHPLIEVHGFTPAPYSARFSWVATDLRPPLAWDAIDALLRDAHAHALERVPAHVRHVVQRRIS